MSPKSDLTKVTPSKDLTDSQCHATFQRLQRRLAAFRNTAELHAAAESAFVNTRAAIATKDAFVEALNTWAEETQKNIWLACREPGGEQPEFDPLSDTSTVGLPPLLPQEHLAPLLHTVLLLHVTSNKEYSSRTRTFLFLVGPIDEEVVAATLKDPKQAIEEASKTTDAAKEEHARRSKVLRMVGVGVGAVAGGVLIGVTGGLAAPAVGAGVASVLGWLGVGGTAVGVLASGLAGSSVVCGALFGAYGSRKTAQVVGAYTREVRDLAIKPVHKPTETMAVRLCVTGWLETPEDVTAPWTVFGGDDTFALQWEVEALENLSSALVDLIKAQAMLYIKGAIIKQTILAALFSALSPMAWIKITKIIDNPWVQAKTLAVKTGKVLGTLLAQRVLGTRPITLVGYSLGSLVIFEALQHLASLPPSQTLGLVQDVFLFGSPLPVDRAQWAAVRRVAAGRVVNGYGSDDYVLAVLARVSGMNWGVAGLQPVEVQGVENVACDVDGHLKWRGLIGQCLVQCGAPGVDKAEVERQLARKAAEIEKQVNMTEEEADRAVKAGPGSDTSPVPV
ncbi:hypothetical protein TRAPUB_3071 [Trametes pubescens]|uniref:Transmembrane and coiled-coil domain-containing protein 4 n=1 Tax=Trametes pubescens TaxID=154538 RepID=A0A1M2VF05_TRAPU|nr:hypothetical protein TRAPUB_3071 [Trametes pubescens]